MCVTNQQIPYLFYISASYKLTFTYLNTCNREWTKYEQCPFTQELVPCQQVSLSLLVNCRWYVMSKLFSITRTVSQTCLRCTLNLSSAFTPVFGRPFVKRFKLCYQTVVCPVLSICPVCNVGVLWPNGWMDQDETWHASRSQRWPQC